MDSSIIPFGITFLSGASYGFTTVLIGQPLDTVKTRMQGMGSSSAGPILHELYFKEGIRGLYRGGLPLLIGGSIMRSAQFGVSAKAKELLEASQVPRYKLLNTLDSYVLLAGISGGIGRAMVEIPTDFLKIRRQVAPGLKDRIQFQVIRQNLLDGSLVTFSRNTILFTSFIVYIDLSKQLCQAGIVPQILCNQDRTSLTPFAKGAICANMAWITCWPFDVVKTQRQSGNFSSNVSSWQLLKENFSSGRMFSGLFPGLIRSSLANGTSMVVYETVHSNLSNYFEVQRKDML
jgi:solute carrier family 25 carnitine/acylcarnitine transporter 20/29